MYRNLPRLLFIWIDYIWKRWILTKKINFDQLFPVLAAILDFPKNPPTCSELLLNGRKLKIWSCWLQTCNFCLPPISTSGVTGRQSSTEDYYIVIYYIFSNVRPSSPWKRLYFNQTSYKWHVNVLNVILYPFKDILFTKSRVRGQKYRVY